MSIMMCGVWKELSQTCAARCVICTQTVAQSDKHASIHTHTCTYTCTHMPHTHAHTHTQTHTHIHRHTYTDTHTHTHTHTHTRTRFHAFPVKSSIYLKQQNIPVLGYEQMMTSSERKLNFMRPLMTSAWWSGGK